VLANPELEIFSPPRDAGRFEFTIQSSQQITQKRREEQLKRLKQAADSYMTSDIENFVRRGSQIHIDEDMKRLEKDASRGTGIQTKTRNIGGN
jgi:hypothetical protein